MIRRYFRILLVTLGILLLTIPGLSACARPAATTPATKPAPAVTEEKAAVPEKEVVTSEKPTPTQAPAPAPQPAPTPPAAPAPPSAPTPMKIDISGFAFASATVTIPVGTTVIWTNKDSVAHTVSSRDNLFDSGSLSSGATFSYTFNQIGTFEYYCKFHPSMIGKIVVGPEGTAPSEEKPAPKQDTGY